MDAQQLRVRVKQVISEQADDYPIDRIAVDQRLEEHLGLDSLDRVELVIRFEEELGIHLDDADFERLQLPTTTVQDLIVQAEKQTNQQGTSA